MNKKDLWDLLYQGHFEEVINKGLALLEEASGQNERDEIRWPMGYAYLELKDFHSSKLIWQEIYERKGDNRSLHQLGMVERESGNVDKALSIFLKEAKLIENKDDNFAMVINLYELANCNLLLGHIEAGHKHFEEYEKAREGLQDPVEKACYYRLKGDFARSIDKLQAKECYLKSLRMFELVEDIVGIKEVKAKINAL